MLNNILNYIFFNFIFMHKNLYFLFFLADCIRLGILIYMKNTIENNTYTVIILGAGASGLQCALTAARRGLKVLILDHNACAGKKICISGGGKANFTNLHMGTAFYYGEDVTFAEPALEAFTPKNLLDYLVSHNLSWEEREHGQLFGLQSAQKIVDAFMYDCETLGCDFIFSHSVQKVAYNQNLFSLTTKTKTGEIQQFYGENLVLALGSPAWEKVGASSFGMQLAQQWGHKAKTFSPVLTSLHLAKENPLLGLSGIALPVTIKVADRVYSEALLFTHAGISGPAVLQASCYWQQGQKIDINFLPHMHFEDFLDAPECGKLFVRNLLSKHIPQRLADAILPTLWARRKIAELSRKARNEVHNAIHNFSVIPEAKGGMHRAEAAAGGILTKEINPWSMESLLQKKLYIVGETLDITGQLGGYNLHWAFASGHIAGLTVE